MVQLLAALMARRCKAGVGLLVCRLGCVNSSIHEGDDVIAMHGLAF